MDSKGALLGDTVYPPRLRILISLSSLNAPSPDPYVII